MKRSLTLLSAVVVFSVCSYAQEFDVKYTSTALERFFFNGSANNANNRKVYYDENNRIVMSAFLNANGTERSRTINRYDDQGRQVESSIWDRRGDSWNRWYHSRTEVMRGNGFVMYVEYVSRYDHTPEILSVTTYDDSGRKTYSAVYGFDGSVDITVHNEHGNVTYHEYEHEKTDGVVYRHYLYNYEDGSPLSCNVRNEKDEIVQYITNTYEAGRLVKQVTKNVNDGSTVVTEYTHSGDRVIRQSRVDPDTGEPVFMQYTEYDEKGRVLKRGEQAPSYERYWTYDYE